MAQLRRMIEITALSFRIMVVLIFIATLIFSLLSTQASFAVSSPEITASSAILIDAKTGRTLWEKKSRTLRPVASTTKMMTAILAIENLDLDDIAVTSPQAAAVGEAEIYLEPGEMMSVENLLFGTLLKSGNDSAVVLAESVGGTVNDFVSMMNRKAKEIGAQDTFFKNPTGLQETGHESTAYDLGLMARYALKNETFAKMVATKSHKIPWSGHDLPRSITNHNKLLLKLDYVTGVKTGYTKEAGHCLVSSAVKGDKELIAVVLNSAGSEECYQDSEIILNYGFAAFSRKTVMTKDEEFKTLPIWGRALGEISAQPAEDVVMLMKDGEELSFEKSIVTSYPNRSIKRGERVGQLILCNEGGDLAAVDLVAKNDVNKSFFWNILSIFIEIMNKLSLFFKNLVS